MSESASAKGSLLFIGANVPPALQEAAGDIEILHKEVLTARVPATVSVCVVDGHAKDVQSLLETLIQEGYGVVLLADPNADTLLGGEGVISLSRDATPQEWAAILRATSAFAASARKLANSLAGAVQVQHDTGLICQTHGGCVFDGRSTSQP